MQRKGKDVRKRMNGWKENSETRGMRMELKNVKSNAREKRKR